MRRFLIENSLSLFFLVLFLATLGGQSLAGQHAFNEEQLSHGQAALSWTEYVWSPHFGQAVMENWQSEYLQFTLFILATIWLVQKGSNESKEIDSAGLESEQKQRIGGHAPPDGPSWAKRRGWRTALYQNSLVSVMLAIFLGAWLAQSLTGWRVYNDEQRAHDQPAVSWSTYAAKPDFWEQTLQNWQSEFLAVGTMAVFTIYLRQRGSPESKPVGAPHDETGSSG